MVSEEFTNALRSVQYLQLSAQVGNFIIDKRWDDYYGDYINVTIVNDDEKWFFSTMRCVTEEDYTKIIQTLKDILSRIE